MGLLEVVLERLIGIFWRIVLLYPPHPPGRQVGRRPETRLIPQNLEVEFRRLKRKGGCTGPFPTPDSEYLPSHLPDMGATPLDDVGRGE